MMILTVVLCSLALGWLMIRLLSLFSIPIDEAIKILNITVPKSPVLSIDCVTADSVGLHWECSSNSENGQMEETSGQNLTNLSSISHYVIYLNGIELSRIPGTENSVVLTSLEPNSHYQIDLVSFNNLNFRSRSTSIYVRTGDNGSVDIEKKLLNIADDSTQVLPCDPKLLYEDNVDEKLKQQIQPVQYGGRSRSSTLENASMISLQSLTFPTPSEITNIEDLKYHLERAQEDLRNTMIQQTLVLTDFNEQEKGYKSTLMDLNERMKIEDKNRAASKLELSYLEDAKLKLRGRIDKLKLNLSTKKLEIEKKEHQIENFDTILKEKQERCDNLIANQDNEFHNYTLDIEKIRQQTSDLILLNQQLEDSVKSETVTRKKLESLRNKLVPIFIALSKATNAEGDLEKEGIVALADLKVEHAEWYQTIKNLIDTTSQDRAQGIAQKLKIESKLEQHKRQILLLKEETDALKTAKKENSSTLLRNTYINNDSASSISNLSNLNLIALLSQPARALGHQQSIPSLSDHITNSTQQLNVGPAWGFSHSRIPSQAKSLEVANQYDTSTELVESNFLLTMLPNELLEDDTEAFFKRISGTASMNRVDTFYSANSSSNPFSGLQDKSMTDYNAMEHSPFTDKSVRYDTPLDGSSLNMQGGNSNGTNTPTYLLASSPPVSSNTHVSNPSGGNVVGSSFGGLTSFNSNDSFLPMTTPPNSEYLPLSNSVFPQGQEDKPPHPSAFSARRFSKTFGFLKSNEQNSTISSTLPSSHNTSINTSRFFSWKKPAKSADEQFQPSFAQINSLGTGMDALAAANLSRERSGSFNSHNSSSIWNNYSNSATNYHRFLDNPLSQRPSFELVTTSSPRSNGSYDLSTSPLNIPGVLNFDNPPISTSNILDLVTPSLVIDSPSEPQMRKYPTRSSTSYLSRENSNVSNLSSSQQQDPPSSPSYFKKIFAGTSPVKHEKNASINSNPISVSGDSEAGEASHSLNAGRTKIFKINRKNSTGTANSASTTNSNSGVLSISSPSYLSSSVGSNASAAPQQQSSSGSSSSNSASKKLKNLIFPKRKGHDEDTKTDTEDTIEEASDESSLKE